jgi:hypothetical protein
MEVARCVLQVTMRSCTKDINTKHDHFSGKVTFVFVSTNEILAGRTITNRCEKVKKNEIRR